MPQGYVQKLAKKHGISLERAEHLWKKAKKIAAQEGNGEDYGYITGIFKRMMKEEVEVEPTPFPSFRTFLNEMARKNPEENPKVSVYEALQQYKDDPTIYISFTDVDKIGINPQSKYNTPLGIYSYNLEVGWGLYDVDRYKSLKGFPFAADKPYVNVLKAKGGDGFVEDMYTDYTSADYDKDVVILERIWKEEAPKIKTFFISYDYEADVKKAQDLVKHNQDMIDALGKEDDDFGGYEDMIAKYEKKLKFSQDNLKSLEREYEQTVTHKYWTKLVEDALESAKDKNPIMSFWNLSRIMAMRLAQSSNGIKAATKWNALLRACGYTGFGDLSGRGYVHPSEPMQTVFLSRHAFTVLDRIPNKDYRDKKIIRRMDDLVYQVLNGGVSPMFANNIIAGGYSQVPFVTTGGRIQIMVSYDKLMQTFTFDNCKDLLVACYKKMVENKDDPNYIMGLRENVRVAYYPLLFQTTATIFLDGEKRALSEWYRKVIDFGKNDDTVNK